MSDPTRSNRTIYIGGLPQSITEDTLVSTFSAFGDIVDVQLPRHGGGGAAGEGHVGAQPMLEAPGGGGGGHRGFGFLVFSTDQEAQDAIDNMHLNELGGRILNVNQAKPLKTAASGGNKPVWEDEEWIKKYAKPIGGGAEDEPLQEGAVGGEQ
ncbi:RNA-binding domain-containing protein [Microstroma glucosiphilum]|uniref:RNA-binding domain-containing protein n=1 Tax=Pseudomicrostroma glucosiphilum TaxID=1684307 RepID=A0A316UHG4_9BASI|nr:RNA-binding domain-containing protein [Pseudomicrostroma glucosiphilum]PWN22635.1 RNA-binding domain-containing protein [Pseudomicrostroma glucosiphilum]